MKTLVNRYHEPRLNGAAIAEEMGMSRMHLYRHLKRYYRRSAREMINEFRLRQSQQLILNTSLKMSEIALAVGLSDPAYFSRLFRKRYGLSPLDFRRQEEE